MEKKKTSKKIINNVNNLTGKEWLKNAVNYWNFKNLDVEKIYERIKSFCYKEKEKTNIIKNIGEKRKQNESDFSFDYITRLTDIKIGKENIIKGKYNSYHAILLKDESISGKYVLLNFTSLSEIEGIEYRGKIVIKEEKTNNNYLLLLFLNRIEKKNENNKLKETKFLHRTTKSYFIESKTKMDKIGLKHPAPFSYVDIEKICNLEKIKNKTILDPFLGVGSTIIGTYKENKNVGIELNPQYIKLIKERFKLLGIPENVYEKTKIICGDSLQEVKNIKEKIDCVITSPPYFNILKNKAGGVRSDKSQKRQGREYYSENKKDLGNLEQYESYIEALYQLFNDIKKKIVKGGKVYIIISDFTVNKKEKDVHSDIIMLMNRAGYKYNGTSYILQNQKAIYPFGYPYKIVLNHIYQYIIKFEV